MAKDLRGLLEPAAASAHAKGGAASGSLAQRRSLSSPGEPRVYRVRSGFVCGLCGKLHGVLDKAFDCLGRCTIELRLRSPAGATLQGNAAHYACTACGRGFVNCDDAEQCFERCLSKMKPTPQFEVALRRVQVRYMQRLAAHGVRSLERIDPLTEHTKMLSTLTKEQQALGHKAPLSAVPQSQTATTRETTQRVAAASPNPAAPGTTPTAHVVQPVQHVAAVSVDVPASVQDSLAALSEEPLAAVESEQQSATPQASQTITAAVESTSQAVTIHDETLGSTQKGASELSAQLEESHTELAESLTESETVTSDALTPIASEDVLSGAEQALQDEGASLSDDLDAQLALTEEPPSVKPVAETNMRAIVEGAAAQLDLSPQEENDAHKLFSGQDNVGSRVAEEGASALSALAFATPESFNEVDPDAKESAQARPAAEKLSGDISDSLNALGADDFGVESLGGAFEEASEFAAIAEQPSLTDSMGADVLAILQAPPEGENLELNVKQERILKDKTIRIDTSLLESITSDTGVAPEVTEVFVRKREMKPYRRNNACYTCSACARDFFTKEQVEACFYSHPEEGSDEERVLREKAEKIKGKSVA
ncbi:MAG: hypothetical protein FJY29_05005 [Betaproteobacteria bacterium]|nr:hypothetical protein [Betaproteobacteria bacterium]